MAAAAKAAASVGAGSAKNATGKSDGKWIEVQARTFLNWLNLQLGKRDMKAADLVDDLKNGVKLCQMLEVVSTKSIKHSAKPKMKAHELENCTHAFQFLEKEGLKIVNIGPTDVNNGSEKLVLGLIWTIIYHYSISAGFKSAGPANSKKANAKDLLLEWVRSKIPEYNIQNFTSDWQDGRAICALTNACGGEPALLPNHQQMAPGAALQNCKRGIETAKDDLGVPVLISPEDLSSCPDEHSVMTYVAFFKDAKRQDKGPALPPSQDNAEGREKMKCQHPGCSKMREADNSHPTHCKDHACMAKPTCNNPAKAGTHACPQHACAFPGCIEATENGAKGCSVVPHKCRTCNNVVQSASSPYCTECGCTHPSGCDQEAKGKPFCKPHTCSYTNCKAPADGDKGWCKEHDPNASKGGALPPPWERKADWRKYENSDLGGRCKIVIYFSTTTSSQEIRKNTQTMMQLMERMGVHKRPDFKPATPIDIEMDKEVRDEIFRRVGSKKTPFLFVDDDQAFTFEQVMELNESGKLTQILDY